MNRRLARRRLLAETRDFMLAGRTVPPGGWVATAELLPAVIAYLRTGRRFRRAGLAAAAQLLTPVSGRRSRLDPDDPATVVCARSAATRLRGIARTVAGQRKCLHESLGVAAGLRRLGFPVEVVVGYPVIEAPSGDAELHAWPQLGAATVVDRPGNAPLNYVELVRYPGLGSAR